MPITFKRAGQEAVTLENVSFKGVALDKVTFKRAGHEAVTVFERMSQLATPQNVTADGTTVSWDAVENATSYEVIEGGNNVLGTVKASFTLSARNNESLVTLKYKKDGIVTSSDYDGTLNYTSTPTNIEGIKSYITFGAFGNEDTMPISSIYDMVNCTAEQVSAQVAKLILTGDASATLNPRD